MEALSAPVGSVPVRLLEPLQPPEATQAEALVDAHVRLADADFWTVPGATASETEGGDGAGVGIAGVGVVASDEAPPPQPTRIAAMIDNAPRSSGRAESRFKSGSCNTQI